MKRASVFLFVAYLLLTTVGYSVYLHFCGDELMKTSVFMQKSCCGDEDKDDCCKNEVKEIRLADNYIPENFKPVIHLPVLATFSIPVSEVFVSRIESSSFGFCDHSPPFKDQSTSLLQVFRI
jgi:hypothetical protein